MYIQTLNYASPKNYNSNEPSPSPSRMSRPSSARIRSIAAFDEFAYRNQHDTSQHEQQQQHQQQQHQQQQQQQHGSLPYSQSDLYIGMSPSSSPVEAQLNNAQHFRVKRVQQKHFVNFDGTTNHPPELNAVQFVRPSMYMFSTDNEGNFVTPRTPLTGTDKIRWKSSQGQNPRPLTRNGINTVTQQTMYLPELANNDSVQSLASNNNSPTRSTFKYATKRVANPKLRFKKHNRTRKKNNSDNSDLSMNANIIRARIARRRRKQSIQYTARASQSLLQTQQTNLNDATNSGSETLNENQDGNISSRIHSSRSISPLDDESHYHANLAKNREMARIRAAAAVKQMKRNKNNPETKIPKTDRHRYRDEKIKSLTYLNTKMSDQKFTIWSHILMKESWSNQVDMFGSQWFTSVSSMSNNCNGSNDKSQKSSKAPTQDIDQVQTLINGKDAKKFFNHLETCNQC